MVASGGAEHSLDGAVDAMIGGEFSVELLASGGSEAVEADLAVGFGIPQSAVAHPLRRSFWRAG